jgi:hypothetical protein
MLARRFRKLLLLPTLAVSLLGSGSALKADSVVMGWIERVRIHPEDLLMEAKLDTGAKTTSVDAAEIVEFTRDGKKWVRFNVSDRKGRTVTFERPIVRIARIRRSEMKTTSRPVVMLPLCIGNVLREVQVNLAKRSHLSYPMLIGRTSLKGTVIVDPSRKLTKDPMCQGKKPDKG